MMSKQKISAFEPLKFFGIVAMVLAHCFIFLYRVFPEYSQIQDLNFIHRFAYFNGLYSMTLPALAGVFFFEKIKNHIRGQFLFNIDLAKLFKPIGLLYITESFKNALIFGFEAFFRWDVLHFISISLVIIISILSQWGVRSFYYILLASSTTIFLLSYFDLSQIIHNTSASYFIMSYQLGILLICALYFFVLNYLVKLNLKISIFLVSIILGLLLSQSSNQELNLIVSNFTISVFVQLGQNGGHIWPLFPWINCLIVGFLTAQHFAEKKQTVKRTAVMVVLLQIPVIYFVFFQLESYQDLLSKHDFFTSLLFKPHWLLFVILNLFFIAAAYSFDLILKFVNFNLTFISQINKYILPIYFIHLAVAWKIARPLTMLFPVYILKWLYPLVVVFLTFCFMQLFLLASDKMIWFRLRKADKR